jgi:cellulose synthase/poly-beta-1,6-N-acetylglucosamine synthase-like glycosyltransferase
MLVTAAIVLLAIYLLKILFFWTGARRASKPTEEEYEPTVSIIVAARNEEKNIKACVDSLLGIAYPPEKLEIIIMDDQSTDRTAGILAGLKEHHPHLTILQTAGSTHGLHGKANAVSQAIDHASGEIIMTTDADCIVPRDWVSRTVRQYTPETGCVCGVTLIKYTGPFTGMQALDWSYLLTIASAGVGWGLPLSAVGNNMSFRRSAYDDVGGYRNVGFSVTEDFILFKAIAYESKWKLRYALLPDTLVWSEPCNGLKDVYRQKKRWGRGGVDIHPVGFFIMSVGFLMNLAILVLPFTGITLASWLTLLIGKSVGDIFLLTLPLKRLGQRRLFRYFPFFELYYLIYVTVLPFIVFLTGRVVWKDRKL